MKRARPLGRDGRAIKVARRERADGASHLDALVASRTSSPLLDRGVRGDVASLDGGADGRADGRADASRGDGHRCAVRDADKGSKSVF